MKETVYVLSNPAYPHIFKIGMTTGCPYERAKALSSTGVLHQFKVEYYFNCDNAHKLEQATHKLLKKYRVNNRKEFFRVTLQGAKAMIKIAASKNNMKLLTMDEIVKVEKEYIVKHEEAVAIAKEAARRKDMAKAELEAYECNDNEIEVLEYTKEKDKELEEYRASPKGFTESIGEWFAYAIIIGILVLISGVLF